MIVNAKPMGRASTTRSEPTASFLRRAVVTGAGNHDNFGGLVYSTITRSVRHFVVLAHRA